MQNRNELIAGISHNLRTPLTSIKAYIEGLLEGVAASPQKQQKYMKTILAKANDIDRMVDKLFLFSKLDLGDCPFYPEKLNIGQEIRSVITSNEKEYREKGMQILCKDIPQDMEVYADPVQLRSAITNILENSLKYKDSETVTVEIYCENSAEDVSVIIEDNGPGVPSEALPKLFDDFTAVIRQGIIQTKEADWGLPLLQKFWNVSAVQSMQKIYSQKDYGS